MGLLRSQVDGEFGANRGCWGRAAARCPVPGAANLPGGWICTRASAARRRHPGSPSAVRGGSGRRGVGPGATAACAPASALRPPRAWGGRFTSWRVWVPADRGPGALRWFGCRERRLVVRGRPGAQRSGRESDGWFPARRPGRGCGDLGEPATGRMRAAPAGPHAPRPVPWPVPSLPRAAGPPGPAPLSVPPRTSGCFPRVPARRGGQVASAGGGGRRGRRGPSSRPHRPAGVLTAPSGSGRPARGGAPESAAGAAARGGQGSRGTWALWAERTDEGSFTDCRPHSWENSQACEESEGSADAPARRPRPGRCLADAL